MKTKDKQWIKIIYFSYLKRPYYHWTIHNEHGGSFSNSGEHQSFSRCIAEARKISNYTDLEIKTYSIDENGNEILIPEKSFIKGAK